MNENIHKLAVHELGLVKGLFEGWEDTMVFSCLQGLMGNAYVTEKTNPDCAQLVVGDFCFLAGTANRSLAAHIPEEYKSGYLLVIPSNREWEQLLLEVCGERAEKITRYAIKKEPGVFDREHLRKLVAALPSEYRLVPLEGSVYDQVMAEDWSRDFCAVFDGYEDYQKNGLGVVAMYEGKPAAGASSYTYYKGGIEIEIDTESSHRRKGLAAACGAALILKCLNQGLYPSWDAHDLRSVSLAEKLGYHKDRAYTAYGINKLPVSKALYSDV